MTNRERFKKIMHYEAADRLPAVHFGYWKELLDEWVEQGHISREIADGARGDNDPRQKVLNDILGWDFNYFTTVGTRSGLMPRFERKVLETLPNGFQRVMNSKGLIERIRPGAGSIPSEDDYTLKDRDAFEELYRPRMQYSDARVNVEALGKFNETRDKENPIGLNLGSVLGEIRDMVSVVGMSYLLYDEDEELFADIVDTYADMQYRCAEAALATGAEFDFAHYWEDVCFKNGPLLSPEIFDELCAKHYKKRNELCHRYGIDIISIK